MVNLLLLREILFRIESSDQSQIKEIRFQGRQSGRCDMWLLSGSTATT